VSECEDCGFEAKFPACPSFLAFPEMITFKVLSSKADYVSWLAGGQVGPEPARKKKGKVDSLVSVVAPPAVFLRVLNELLSEWVKHYAVETHQLLTRNASIAHVARAPVGERLEVTCCFRISSSASCLSRVAWNSLS
jgi:hypothetical protein